LILGIVFAICSHKINISKRGINPVPNNDDDAWWEAAKVGIATGLLAYNGWFLSYDLACHQQYPGCSYQFEAVTLATSGDTGLVPQLPNPEIRSS